MLEKIFQWVSIDSRKEERLSLSEPTGPIVIYKEGSSHVWKCHLFPLGPYHGDRCDNSFNYPPCSVSKAEWPTLDLDFSFDRNDSVSCYLTKCILHFISWNVPHKIFFFFLYFGTILLNWELVGSFSLSLSLSLSLALS